MRITSLAPITIAATLILTSCATKPTDTASNYIHKQKVVVTTTENYPAKNPEHVSFYEGNKKPNTAYRVIGTATISKYNLLGMQRQETTLNAMMKKIAASMGGDAVMNINNNKDNLQASIIAYQKILI